MTLRQAVVCAVFGPLCAVWFLGLVGCSPMLAAMGWLLGSSDPIADTWEIISEPPIELFKGAYRGFHD